MILLRSLSTLCSRLMPLPDQGWRLPPEHPSTCIPPYCVHYTYSRRPPSRSRLWRSALITIFVCWLNLEVVVARLLACPPS
ncbi:hypothetical protein VTI74DRAFT_6633 [Chaetomium olivicolor]